jgi:hypothetical protein
MKKILLFILLSYSSFGQIAFQKTYGGYYSDVTSSVRQAADGGYILAGTSANSSSSYRNVYMVRTDTNGDTLWTKLFSDSGNFNVANVLQVFDGGFVVTGDKYNISNNSTDIFILKTDSAGNLLWIKNYGGANAETGSYITQTSDSDLVVIGQTTSFGAGGDDIYLIRTNADGDVEWSRTYGAALGEAGTCVQQTHDGGFITGSFASNFLLIRTDGNGDTLWTRLVGTGTAKVIRSLNETADHGYL